MNEPVRLDDKEVKNNRSDILKSNVATSNKDDIDWVENQIDLFSRIQISFTGRSEMFFNYTIKDKGETVAGINSCFYFEEVLCVNVLFVKEEYRGQGLGSLLLKKVEDEAKKNGAKLSHLHTFDFHQAKEFYLKHGYEVFGVLEDCPMGYKHYYMKKFLYQQALI